MAEVAVGGAARGGARGGEPVARAARGETIGCGDDGGDAANGTSSVIASIRDSRIAASEIDKYLGGEGLESDTPDMTEFVSRQIDKDELLKIHQAELPVHDLDSRVESFVEVEKCFTKCTAVKEAGRCWRCDWNE